MSEATCRVCGDDDVCFEVTKAVPLKHGPLLREGDLLCEHDGEHVRTWTDGAVEFIGYVTDP